MSNRKGTKNMNDGGNEYGPQSRQRVATPNAGSILTPPNRNIQRETTMSSPKVTKRATSRNFQEQPQEATQGGGNNQSRFVDRTQSQRQQGSDYSEQENESDHGQEMQETRIRRGKIIQRQVSEDEKYSSNPQRESTKDREQFFKEQLGLMEQELNRVRIENLNLT
jgi:hypothetical protein